MKKGGGAAGAIFAVIAVVRVIAYFVSHGSQAANDREFDSYRTTQVALAGEACRSRGGFFVARQYDFTSTCVVPATRSAASGSAISGSAASGSAASGGAATRSGSAAVGTGSARTATGTAGTPSSLTATPWTDPAGTITLQYDSAWAPGQIPANLPYAVLALSGPEGVRIYVQEVAPSLPLADNAQADIDSLNSSQDTTFTFDPVMDLEIGGEPAKAVNYRGQAKATPTASIVRAVTYYVDHGGKRYIIGAGGVALDRHRAEVDAIVRSVRFTS